MKWISGLKLCFGQAVDVELFQLVTKEVAELRAAVETWKIENETEVWKIFIYNSLLHDHPITFSKSLTLFTKSSLDVSLFSTLLDSMHWLLHYFLIPSHLRKVCEMHIKCIFIGCHFLSIPGLTRNTYLRLTDQKCNYIFRTWSICRLLTQQFLSIR